MNIPERRGGKFIHAWWLAMLCFWQQCRHTPASPVLRGWAQGDRNRWFAVSQLICSCRQLTQVEAALPWQVLVFKLAQLSFFLSVFIQSKNYIYLSQVLSHHMGWAVTACRPPLIKHGHRRRICFFNTFDSGLFTSARNWAAPSVWAEVFPGPFTTLWRPQQCVGWGKQRRWGQNEITSVRHEEEQTDIFNCSQVCCCLFGL